MPAVTHGTSTALTITEIHSLATADYASSSQVTPGDGHDIIIGGKFEFATAPTDAETVEVYLVGPYDYANQTTTIGAGIEITGVNGITSTSKDLTEGTDFMKENLILGATVTVSNDVEQHFFTPFSVVSVLGYYPKYFSVVVHNNTSVSTHASGSEIMYTTITYGSA